MTREDAVRLVDYNAWANARLLEAAGRLAPDAFTRPMGNSFPSVRDTLVHIMRAEAGWLARWEGRPRPDFPPVETYGDAGQVAAAWHPVEEAFRAFAGRLTDAGLMAVRGFTRPDGTEAAYQMDDMLQHVVNHGTYHRGQVVTLLRQQGAEPAATDFIRYAAERPRAG